MFVRVSKLALFLGRFNRLTLKRAASAARHTVLFLLILSACGGGSDGPTTPTPPPVPVLGPISVTLVSATPTSVHLKNAGGPGSYRLDVWGRFINTNVPSGCHTSQLIDGRCPVTAVKVWEFEPVAVLAGYDEQLSITATGIGVYAYKVFSRPVNSAVWTQTDCKRAVDGAWLNFACP